MRLQAPFWRGGLSILSLAQSFFLFLKSRFFLGAFGIGLQA
jgi:hypothetical protein